MRLVDMEIAQLSSLSALNVTLKLSFKLRETRIRDGTQKIPLTSIDEWFTPQWKWEWGEMECRLCVIFSTCLLLAILMLGKITPQ
jgi:hypothetical protein